MGMVTHLHAHILYVQGRLEEAKPEVLRAAEIFENLGAAQNLNGCRVLLQCIQEEMDRPVTTHESDSDGELLGKALFPTPINSPFLGQGPE